MCYTAQQSCASMATFNSCVERKKKLTDSSMT
jgi:hypothetical protein